MYVRGSIVVVLALLISSTVFAGDIGRAKTAYEGVKRQFISDPSTYQSQINDALNAVITAINSAQLNNTNTKIQNKWVADERAWIDSVIPAAPARVPVLPIRGPIASATPGTKLRAQADLINQLIADFDAAVAAHDLDQMFDRYNEMLVVIPTLDLIDEKDRQATLKQTQATLEQEATKINRRPQAKQAMQLLEDFDKAAAAKDLTAMQRIYNEMQRVFPTLGLLSENTRNEYLSDAQRAIEQVTLPKAPFAIVKQVADILKDFRAAAVAHDRNAMSSLHIQALGLFRQYSGLNQAVMDEIDSTMAKALAASAPTSSKNITLAQAQEHINNLFEILEKNNDHQRTYALVRLIRESNNGDKESTDDLRELVERMASVPGKPVQQARGYEALQDYQTDADWRASRWYSVKRPANEKIITRF